MDSLESPSNSIICLTGAAGSGKSSVLKLFEEYKDVQTFTNIDDLKNADPSKRCLVLDCIKTPDELTYIRWLCRDRKPIVVNVHCKNDRRINRLQERDNCTELSIGLRDKVEKTGLNLLLPLINYNIHNSRSLEETKADVYYIHGLLCPDPKPQENILVESRRIRASR